ncbi:Eaa1 [Klebsiella pneumoniae]|nr:Eaa1 [Klebsiella pneumoniae]
MNNCDVNITKEQLTEWVSQLDSDGGCDATDHQLAALIRQSLVAMDSKPGIADCDPEVFGKGVSVCLISIPKETAEVICKNITAATGCKVDWHYFGGRVHIKALPPSLQTASEREQVRREHAEWSQATFGDVGPVGPLRHLSKEALEAAADPSDSHEWADMQFLLWDAQRRMGISDEFITRAMIEKLAINKARQWPEPKDGEPRMHVNQEADNDSNPAD